MSKIPKAEGGGAAIKAIRQALGWTQAETAHFLGVSKKSVESYEQGWRHPPQTLCKQMITLLALNRGYPANSKPCWEVMRCSPAVRDACFCARKMGGHFCWLTCSANCHQHLDAPQQEPGCCFHCPVVQQLMKA